MIQHIELIHFRNFTELSLDLGAGIHAFTGLNGQGKTNFLEAIYLLSQTKSFRNGFPKDWLQLNSSFSMIRSEWVNKPFQSLHWGVYLGKSPQIQTDFIPTKNIEHIGKIPLIGITPEDHELIQAGGTERRAWLNAWIAQFNRPYLLQLVQWEKYIQQRNALLENSRICGILDKNLMEIYNQELIPLGISIHQTRKKVLEELNQVFQPFHNQLCMGQEEVQLSLHSTFIENTAEEWRSQIEAHVEKDKRLGRSHVGIHKEDVDFQIHQKPLKLLGSQGQQKTYLIALKLAQLHYLKKQGSAPLLLLDDIFDKMDENRMKKVAEMIYSIEPEQVFITDTQAQRIQKSFTAYPIHHLKVEQGKIFYM